MNVFQVCANLGPDVSPALNAGRNKFMIRAGITTIATIAATMCIIKLFVVSRGRKRRADEAATRKSENEAEQAGKGPLDTSNSFFRAELGEAHENASKNDVVSTVNELARRTATACVNQDRAHRREEVDPYPEGSTWDSEVTHLKQSWRIMRKFIIYIAPELEERMPHFSEFEPLKSYNDENLQKKAEKQKAT